MKTQLLIIGGGPGGYETAVHAAQEGMQVTIVEKAHLGGTCLNVGCIPTKALVHDAASAPYHEDKATYFMQAMERKDGVISGLRQGIASLMKHPNINLIEGVATFVEDRVVEVNGEQIEAEHIIIATGSTSKILPIPGLGNDGQPSSRYVLTSDELLSLDHLPQELCIIGAGVIGMEMASIFASFGCQVTVVEFLKECLPSLDADLAKRLRKLMEKRGIKFYMNSAVQRVEDSKVTFKDNKKGTETTITSDHILIATGRRPMTEGLGLEHTTIITDRGAIVTNDHMMTNVEHVYAIGDVNGKQMLAHAASFQGQKVIRHIMGKEDHIRLDIMPAAIFTAPEAASVGVSEDYCKTQGLTYTTNKAMYRANGRAQAMEETEGMVKLIFDENDKIIGCHAFGADAAAIVQEVATLMNFDATKTQLRDIVHIHPTLSEVLLSAAQA